jgi:hypothetical protein
LAYQPPASRTFLSEQTSQQYFPLKTTQHQPNEQVVGLLIGLVNFYALKIIYDL